MTLREKRIQENLGLVHSCANKFKGRGVEYDDLFQAGCVGLIKAVDGFDESLGYVFSTYAVPAILGEIKRIFRDGGAVKISVLSKELELIDNKEEDLIETNEDLIKEIIVNLKSNFIKLNNHEKKMFLERFVKEIRVKKEGDEVMIESVVF